MKTVEQRHLSGDHLSGEQLYEALDSPERPPVHLAECAACRDEVEGLRVALTGFRETAKGLARGGVRWQPEMTRRTGVGSWLGVRLAWGLAAASVVGAVSLSAAHRHEAPAAVAAGQSGQEAHLANEDAELLEGIDQDLSASVPPSLAPLDVSAGESSLKAN